MQTKSKYYRILFHYQPLFTTLFARPLWQRDGIYNVSFQAFRNDSVGKECLKKWREQCIEWCYNYYDALHNRYADQKYLEEWQATYGEQLMVLSTPTSNLALWNVNQYQLSYKNGQVFSNGLPIVFYHFSNVKILNNTLVQTGFYWAQTRPQTALLNHIYLPYIKKIKWYNQLIFNKKGDQFTNENAHKSFSGLRLAMRERGLLFTFDKLNRAFNVNFSWVNNIHDAWTNWAKKEPYLDKEQPRQYDYEK